MSLALDPALVEQLNAVCASKRISRDAFFNRVFLLLAADPPLIDDLLFTDRSWRAEVWTENKHDGPFFQSAFYPLEPNTEPFWAIRNGLELRVGDLGTPEHWTEPCSGKSIRIHRTHGGDPMPLESLYSIVLDKKFRGGTLLGFNTYMPDWLVPRLPAHERYQASIADLLVSLGTT